MGNIAHRLGRLSTFQGGPVCVCVSFRVLHSFVRSFSRSFVHSFVRTLVRHFFHGGRAANSLPQRVSQMGNKSKSKRQTDRHGLRTASCINKLRPAAQSTCSNRASSCVLRGGAKMVRPLHRTGGCVSAWLPGFLTECCVFMRLCDGGARVPLQCLAW